MLRAAAVRLKPGCGAALLTAAAVFGVSVWLVSSARLPAPVLAEPAPISQGFSASSNLPTGALVSQDPNNLGNVILSDLNNANNLVGVVTAQKNAALSITTPKATIQVGTAGIFYTNVATINGEIHKNDRITISPISGVGMKAVVAGKVIGTAQADFNAQSSGARSQTINDKTGHGHTVAIGQIPVLVMVETWAGPNASTTPLIKNLQSALGTVTGKSVSPVRAVSGLAILLIGLALAGIIVFTSVSTSIHSLGRNPLAQHSVTRNLVMVLSIVVILILATFIIAYYVLSG